MRPLLAIVLVLSGSCRVPPPEGPAEAARQGQSSGDEAPSPGAPASVPAGAVLGDVPVGPPRATQIVDDLVAAATAAVSGQDLPETSFALPGTRGEQVVAIQGGAFPEGALTAFASMIKVDVTLAGCGPQGGLTIGIFQSGSGSRIVGLGDQLNTASSPTAAGLDEVVAAAAGVIEAIRQDEAGSIILDDATCAAELGSVERCHRIFQELPDDTTLGRYREMLAGCDASPVYLLPVVALFLRDEAGAEFQGIARFVTRSGRLSLTEPIALAPGVP